MGTYSMKVLVSNNVRVKLLFLHVLLRYTTIATKSCFICVGQYRAVGIHNGLYIARHGTSFGFSCLFFWLKTLQSLPRNMSFYLLQLIWAASF